MTKFALIVHKSEYLNRLINFLNGLGVDYKALEPCSDISKYDAVIASGGKIPLSRKEEIIEWYRDEVFSESMPFLGICLGFRILGYYYGAKFALLKEKGIKEIEFFREYPLAPNVKRLTVYQDHDFSLIKLGSSIVNYARSDKCDVQAIKIKGKEQYGVQFHPEVEGGIVLENFVKLCDVV